MGKSLNNIMNALSQCSLSMDEEQEKRQDKIIFLFLKLSRIFDSQTLRTHVQLFYKIRLYNSMESSIGTNFIEQKENEPYDNFCNIYVGL